MFFGHMRHTVYTYAIDTECESECDTILGLHHNAYIQIVRIFSQPSILILNTSTRHVINGPCYDLNKFITGALKSNCHKCDLTMWRSDNF